MAESKGGEHVHMDKDVGGDLDMPFGGGVAANRQLPEDPINFAVSTRAAFSGGTIQVLGAPTLPSLTGEKVAMARVVLEPCGINLDFIPRATEILYVVDAAPEGVLMAFVDEFVPGQGPRAITNVVTTGEATFFPQGLGHMQVNLGCTPATMIAALGSDDFGVQTITAVIAGLASDDRLAEGAAAALGIYSDQLAQLSAGFPTNPAAGSDACRARCGLV
ncbi:cupin-like protein [Tribonema minus]|uniref:Cupin-like protein n=1 Tax=Tribonema minus TaxID=303371 RepID=A0A836CH04_9STRA|nr:cupin-like protein [Tribonema minus]